ncbi:MAG: GtrA family protein [Roseicyclus sp.]
MPKFLSRFTGFAAVSGTGWVIDVVLTMALVQLGVAPFWASMAGAGAAVTFVYVVALRAIFGVGGRIGARGFPLYVLWQVCAISATSALVAVLAGLLAAPGEATLDRLVPEGAADPLAWASGAAKALVTPLTLLSNFFFMRLLTKRL